jgi:hypothetical protein
VVSLHARILTPSHAVVVLRLGSDLAVVLPAEVYTSLPYCINNRRYTVCSQRPRN